MNSWKTFQEKYYGPILAIIFIVLILSIVITPTGYQTSSTTKKKLSVTKIGSGSGKIVTSDAKIQCDPVCSKDYARNAQVNILANSYSGSRFAGWINCDSSAGYRCITTMNTAKTVTAVFKSTLPQGEMRPYTLFVNKAGSTAGGVITSYPQGINCNLANADCSERYPSGTTVLLTADSTSVPGTLFAGWQGCAQSQGDPETCIVTMDNSKTVSAKFISVNYFRLTVSGTGGIFRGTIRSADGRINCGLDPGETDCVEDYPEGTIVELNAYTHQAPNFIGWSGGGCSGAGTCTVTMDNTKTVTANFENIMFFRLTVQRSGSGHGTVTSTDGKINCGTGPTENDCTEDYPAGTTLVNTALVNLNAYPDAASDFDEWSGGGCSGAGTCIVTMDNTKTVTAIFTD